MDKHLLGGGENKYNMAWGLITYQDTSRREDLMDVLADVSPDETPLMTLFGTSTARGTLHEWLKYNISRPASTSSAAEGADAEFADLTAPSRESNITHIIPQSIQVSRTERRVNVAAIGDPYAFQKSDGLRQLKLKMEYAILNSTKASGSSGTARTMTGINAFITTNATARNSGTSFSEAELNDMASDAYTAVSADKVFDMVLCSDRRLIKDVLVYDSAVGSHRIMHHRDVQNTAGTTTVYGLREEMHKIAYLDKPLFQEISKIGDADRGQWVTEFTLEVLEERADLKRTGYNQNG